VAYPNEADRRRLERFPDRIAVEDLRACFALSDRDRVLVFDQRGPENRLGLAVSLCALRFLGFVPDDIASIPDEALGFVSRQVDAEAHELLAYGVRAQTRSDHLQLILDRGAQTSSNGAPAGTFVASGTAGGALLAYRSTL
jgi:TnpA family transposase